MIKKILQTIFILIILTISIKWIYSHQQWFTKVSKIDKDFILNIDLWKFNFIEYTAYSTLWEWAAYSLLTQKLAIDIDKSLSYWKNDWLSKDENFNYINDFLSINRWHWELFNIIYDKIITDEYIVDSKNIEKYSLLIDEYLLKDWNTKIKTNNIHKLNKYDKDYKNIYQFLNEKYCENEYPLNEKYNEFYLKQTLHYIKKEDYNKALCFNVLSWYKNTLAWWQTLTFSIYWEIFSNIINTNNDYILIKEEINYLYNSIIRKIINKNKYDYHKNSNDIIEVRKINEVYKTLINKINYFIIKNNI